MKQDIIRLGSACNQKCLFCNQEDVFDKKAKKQILGELLSFRKKGVERLVISGGEPTLFKEELFFATKTAKKIGFKKIEIQSNAVLLSNNNYVLELKESGLDTSMISLHSYSSEVSDNLTQAKGTHIQTIKGINNLISSGIETTINIVINKENYKDILKYITYVDSTIKGFKDISLSIVVPGKLTKENDLLPNYNEVSKYLTKAYDYCIENNIKFQNPGCGMPVCFIKDYYKYSLEYQNFKSGNMFDEYILEKNRLNKQKSEKCGKCIFNKYCLGLWKGYVDLYGFEGLKPITELKKSS